MVNASKSEFWQQKKKNQPLSLVVQCESPVKDSLAVIVFPQMVNSVIRQLDGERCRERNVVTSAEQIQQLC